MNEVSNLANTARLVVIDTVWGHMGWFFSSYLTIYTQNFVIAGGGANAADDKFIADEITKFFAE